jgi:4-hydroxy-tetrahydrodipicolinate reductase
MPQALEATKLQASACLTRRPRADCSQLGKFEAHWCRVVIRVCFVGVTGWTAPPIVAAIDAADDISLTCGVSRSAAGRTLAEAAAPRSDGSIYASVSEALQSAEVDVLVDYTSGAAVKENVLTAVRAGVHVVVGSSGLAPGDYADLDRLARDRGVGVVAAGNFSIIAAILKRGPRSWPPSICSIRRFSTMPAPISRMCRSAPRENSLRPWQKVAHQSPVPLSELDGPVEAGGAAVAGTRIHSALP